MTATRYTAKQFDQKADEGEMLIGASELVAMLRQAAETERRHQAVELKYRSLLWLGHGHSPAVLYGDDGEMQCPLCVLDYKRDPIERIEAAVSRLNAVAYKLATAPHEPLRSGPQERDTP